MFISFQQPKRFTCSLPNGITEGSRCSAESCWISLECELSSTSLTFIVRNSVIHRVSSAICQADSKEEEEETACTCPSHQHEQDDDKSLSNKRRIKSQTKKKKITGDAGDGEKNEKRPGARWLHKKKKKKRGERTLSGVLLYRVSCL